MQRSEPAGDSNTDPVSCSNYHSLAYRYPRANFVAYPNLDCRTITDTNTCTNTCTNTDFDSRGFTDPDPNTSARASSRTA